MSKTELERLSSVETAMNDINRRLSNIENTLGQYFDKLEKMIDTSNEKFATKADVEEVKKIATTRLWQATLLTVVLTSAITFLLMQYLQK